MNEFTSANTPKNGAIITFFRFDKHFAVLTNCFFGFDYPVSPFSINFAADFDNNKKF